MAKILVVDDEESIVRLIESLLRKESHDVVTASCGDEAMRRYLEEGEDIDLVITDLIMPGKTGVDVILELREKDANIKIIAMTGGGYGSKPNYLSVAELLGATSIMKKPFRAMEMKDEVKKILR